MKNLRKVIIIFIVFLSIFSFVIVNNNTIKSEDGLVEVTDNNGNVIKYRNSSESVMKLSEYNYPTQYLRAAWVSLFVSSMPKYTSEQKWKDDYCDVLDTLEEYGLNCIVFHVRTHNNALYNSKLNPQSIWTADVDYDTFDPLAWAIEETHRRGIEFHAWLNPYRVDTSKCAEDFPEGNPARDEANLLINGSSRILNPGIPENRQFIIDSCMELIENYDVDAINFDDYFYISADDSATMKKYPISGLSSDEWHREQVNMFIHGLSDAIRAYNRQNHKAVQLGIAPSGTYRNGGYVANPTYNSNGDLTAPLYSDTASSQHYGSYLFADTLKWVTNEWIDYMMPQAYWAIEHTSASYASLARWWSWACHYKKVNLYMGMGIYMGASTTGSGAYWQENYYEIRDQLLVAGTHEEIGGICLYSYNYIRNTAKSIKTGMDILKNDFFTTKIPADVKKSLVGVFDKPQVENIKIVANKLSYNKVNDVRGYMIFKVGANEVLNTADINQVYYYGTELEVTLDDPAGSVYYICTVNKANELSTPQNTLAANTNGEFVKSLINTLPSLIDLSCEGQVTKIIEYYNALDRDEKAKVTNYNILSTAKELLDAKIDLTNKINNYGDLANYTLDTKPLIDTLKRNSKKSLNEALTLADANKVYSDFESSFRALPLIDEELKEPRENAIKELNDYYNTIDFTYYTDINQNYITKYYNDGKVDINNAKSSKQVTTALNDAVNKISKVENIKKDYEDTLALLKNKIATYINDGIDQDERLSGYRSRLEEVGNNAYNELCKLDKFELVSTVDDYDVYIMVLIQNEIDTIVDYVKAVKNARTYINAYSDTKEGAKELKQKYLELLATAKTKEEVEILRDNFSLEYKALSSNTPDQPKDDNKSKSSCTGMNVITILSMISMLSVLVFIRKRK